MDWMDRERNFWIVGGDLRQRALARLLREDGHTVHIAALEGEGLVAEPGPGLALAHCVILPLPVTRRGEILHTPLSREEVTLPQLLDWLEARPGPLRRHGGPPGSGGCPGPRPAAAGLLCQGGVHGGQCGAHKGSGGTETIQGKDGDIPLRIRPFLERVPYPPMQPQTKNSVEAFKLRRCFSMV